MDLRILACNMVENKSVDGGLRFRFDVGKSVLHHKIQIN
jgi:hypothetical protein